MSIRQGTNVISGGVRGFANLLDFKWSDHILNDVSWLRSDTFSWQDGGVYEEAYNHLANDIDGKTLTSETVAGTTVQFYLADDGHKICPASEINNIVAIYNSTGVAWYYVIDPIYKAFKLPRDNSQTGRVLIKTLTSGNKWARIYADGWVEQGGRGTSATLLVPMVDTNYTVLSTAIRGNFANSYDCSSVASLTTTGFSVGGINYNAQVWFVSGWANTNYLKNISSQFASQYKYLYFYTGEFTLSALENTAGLNAELFNDKVDLDSSWSGPSDTYDDLTLGASGTTYTAPADGYILLGCSGDAGKAYMEAVGPSNKYLSVGAACNGGWGRGCGYISKGQTFQVYYGGTNFTKQLFRFVYAKKTN